MKRFIALATGLLLLLGANFAYAWHISGQVHCEGTGLPLGGVTIQVTGGGFTGTSTSDDNGDYFISLPDDVEACYEAAPLLGPGESVVTPASGTFDFCASSATSIFTQDWVISSPACSNLGCWLTGGGAKFSQITNTSLGISQVSSKKSSKDFNWGGNVNPGCSPTAGEGGQWNTLDNAQKLHFQGFAIQVVRCGNVDGIPPGSTSPVTPFNFIEFQGTGRVKGIQGNKADYPLVYFFARAEDRNEPGSNGQHDGAGKDRYFLNVYTDAGDPVGSSLILVDVDGDPATVDPLTITDGNMQLHISSCTTPVLGQTTAVSGALTKSTEGARPTIAAMPTSVSLATPRPNPAADKAILSYGLPRDASVSLTVYDVAGRTVRVLQDGASFAGWHNVTWDLRGIDGARVSRGMYFARLRVGNETYTQHLIVQP